MNKYLTKTGIWVVCLMCFTKISYSQDLKSDLGRSISAMMPKDKISMYEVSIRYFNRDNLNHATDSMKVYYSFYGDYYKIRINDIETVQDQNCYVSVSKDDKLMMIGKANKNENRSFDYSKLDSLCNLMNIKISKGNTKKDISQYKVILLESTIDSMEISINTLKNQIEKIVLFFNKDYKATEESAPSPVVQLIYENYRVLDAVSTNLSVFSTDKYFILNDNQRQPTPLYANYKVIDNLKFEK